MEYEEIQNAQTVKTVKDLDPDDQPREKAEKYGCGVLSVSDLWALILRTGLPGKPITELCRDMMHDNGGRLHNLERRDRKALRQMKGIGLTKSIQIEAVMELMRRYAAEEPVMEKPISTSQHIYERMKYKIGNLPHEEVWILLLNRRNMVIRECCLTTGTTSASIFDVRKAIRLALLEDAEGVILCHNHPSGGLVPSTQDDGITRELKNACKLFNIRMLDHTIVTANGYYSYFDNGKL